MLTSNQFGICHLSIVPLRATPSDKAEMISQILFGEVFSILETSENGKWIRVHLQHDHYEGWIDAKQYTSISEDYYQEYQSMSHPCTRQGITVVAFAHASFPIVGGSTLPFLSENSEIDLGFAHAEIVSDHQEVEAIYKLEGWLLDYALSYLSAPYLWGGRTFFGIDCSGLVQQVFRQLNIQLPRDAWQQALVGSPIDFHQIIQGDLSFFKNTEGKITHVGIVLNDGAILHASGEVRIDILDEQGIMNKNNNQYSHHLAFFRRVLEQSIV